MLFMHGQAELQPMTGPGHLNEHQHLETLSDRSLHTRTPGRIMSYLAKLAARNEDDMPEAAENLMAPSAEVVLQM